MTAGHGGKRARREEMAIAGLLAEPTIEAAARKAGIGETTLLRWLAEPEFKARYRAARRSVVESAVGRLQQAASQAVDALARNLACGVPAVEVGAAKAILDQAIKAVELIDLAERVEALERASDLTAQWQRRVDDGERARRSTPHPGAGRAAKARLPDVPGLRGRRPGHG